MIFKFSIIFALALLLTTHVAHALQIPHARHSTRAPADRATFDPVYDNPRGSLNTVACSNGPNGLVTKYPTFNDVPTFPFIGGAPGVTWNSPNCGLCWELTNVATNKRIFIIAIDGAATWNLGKRAFRTLNGGRIGRGVIDVVANEAPPGFCGLPE